MPRTVPRDTLKKISEIYAHAHEELRRLGAERRAIVEAALMRRTGEEMRAARARITAL